MSDEVEVPFEEWLKEKEKGMKKLVEQLENIPKPFFIPKDFVYSGFRSICEDLAELYRALAFIYESMYENDEDLFQIMKISLGLTIKASVKDVKDRAKKLGELNELFIKIREEREAKKEKREKERFYVY